MNPSIYRKIYNGSLVAGFIILILFPSEIIGFFFDLFHSLFDLLFDLFHHLFEIFFELCHLLIEVIESSLDHLIEHLFHTDLHTTQTIVFYMMLIPGIYIGYLLLRVLIFFSRRCVNSLLNAYTHYKTRTVFFWYSLDWLDKIKWIAIFAACLYLMFMVSF